MKLKHFSKIFQVRILEQNKFSQTLYCLVFTCFIWIYQTLQNIINCFCYRGEMQNSETLVIRPLSELRSATYLLTLCRAHITLKRLNVIQCLVYSRQSAFFGFERKIVWKCLCTNILLMKTQTPSTLLRVMFR